MTLEDAQKAMAKNLRKFRKRAGFTQESMREKNFNYRYYQKLESGKTNATLDTIVRLAAIFGCSPADLLKG